MNLLWFLLGFGSGFLSGIFIIKWCFMVSKPKHKDLPILPDDTEEGVALRAKSQRSTADENAIRKDMKRMREL